MNFSIGIPCFNEAANIAKLLDRLLLFNGRDYRLEEILVIASGCTDGTCGIVQGYAAKDPRVRLMIQQQREGKASAVNLFIKESRSDILVLMSGDVLPEEGALAELMNAFDDNKIGVAAGQIVPLNRKNDFIGYYVRLFWRLHHKIALDSFKAGEVVAFRKVFAAIPPDTATDETWVVMQVLDKGFGSRYVPQAVFLNRGPENLNDFFKVRRRHLIGYHHMRRLKPDWKLPETMDNLKVLLLLKGEMSWNFHRMMFLTGSVVMEATARLLAWIDFNIFRRNPFIWPTADSTKRLEDGK
jgi:glycosyltransferase involved in cell wall biosynthesis